MPKNRSVPVDTVLPHLMYGDVRGALDWLGRAFGFVEHYHYGDYDGAQARRGDVVIMLGRARPGRPSPREAGGCTQMLTLFVDDVDAMYARAKAAGGNIFEEPNDVMYGERQFGIEDPEGHRWLVAAHLRDVAPEEWGASVMKDPAR